MIDDIDDIDDDMRHDMLVERVLEMLDHDGLYCDRYPPLPENN